jgi:NADH dehydrogenase
VGGPISDAGMVSLRWDGDMTPPQPSDRRRRIVIIGAGFAGFHCARWLDRHLGASSEVVLVNPADHTVYSALLPDVLGGVVDPSCIATPLGASLPSTRVVIGMVTSVDATAQTCTIRTADGEGQQLTWDRLVLNPGSVTQTFGIAGVHEYTHGFKTIAEAIYLREHILRQLQLASVADDNDALGALGSFVVVGGGFAGLELAAQGYKLTRAALRQHRGLESESVRWTVIEAGPSVLGQFPAKLASRALARIRQSGIDVRLGTPVAEIEPDHVALASGETLPTRTVIWTAGVTPAPLISELGLGMERGRLIVSDSLQARDHPHVFAVGDAAAVPDLTRLGQLAAQTAQHAQRQGVAAARNIAASLANREPQAYSHRDLGFAIDLTGRNAIATPLGLRLSGVLAKLAGRAYHILALPSGRLRVLSDWVNAAISGPQISHLGLVDERSATIQAEASSGHELTPDGAGLTSAAPTPSSKSRTQSPAQRTAHATDDDHVEEQGVE